MEASVGDRFSNVLEILWCDRGDDAGYKQNEQGYHRGKKKAKLTLFHFELIFAK